MLDILHKIKEKYDDFSKGQKLIADFVLNHYEKAAYMTAHKLGEASNVSESTVVRFANELGFDGYPKFQKELLSNVRTKLNSIERMHVINERVEYDDIFDAVLHADIEQIRQTLEENNQDEFKKVIDELINANKIYILGARSSSALATFMSFYFNLIFDNVKVISTASSSEIFEQAIRAKKGDVFIGISFPRYSVRTIKMLKFARNLGVKTIALTDSYKSPLSEISDYTLIAKSDMASFADSLVAPLSVINAIIAAVARKKSTDIETTFKELENMWHESQVYSEDL